MKKRKTTLIILLLVLIAFVGFISKDIISKKYRENRYKEIKEDIDGELKDYLYILGPNCQKGSTSLITHADLVYNRGMDKEKFLDIDHKHYCKTYIEATCVEDGKWNWNTYLSCQNYEDEGYINWADEFKPKR